MKNLILKTLGLCTLALGFSSFSNAKVSDFHSLITDNISAQQELHGEIKKQMKVTDQALNPSKVETRSQAAVFMDLESDQINASTSSKLLEYKKEKSAKSVSAKKQMDRISQEFSDVE